MKTVVLSLLVLLLSSFFAVGAEAPVLDPSLPAVVETMVNSEDVVKEPEDSLVPAVTGDALKPLQAKYQDTQKDLLQYYVVSYSQDNIAESQKVLQKELRLIGYIPYHQYIAKATARQLQELHDKNIIDSFILYRDWNKGYMTAENGETLYYMHAFPDADFKLIAEELRALDLPLLDRQDYVFVLDFKGVADVAAILRTLLHIEGVESVAPRPHYELLNDKTNIVVGVADLRKRSLLFGEGQIIAIADTGLDTGRNDASMHLDFQGRIVSLQDLAYDPRGICQGLNNPDDKRGHGTHVAGSALGDGRRSGSNPALHQYDRGFAGAAPEAKLVFQAIGCDQSGIGSAIPIPFDTKLLLPAYQQGARIHSNSYGGGFDGGYYVLEKLSDKFVHTNKDMLLVFAAGNDAGPGTTSNNLKNGITIGGVWRDQPNTQIYAMGPTKDGRNKPDTETPALASLGVGIMSTKSSVQQPYPVGCRDIEGRAFYCEMAGTSMATPNAAGSVALIREYLIKRWYTPNPSAALIKALYLNGAESLNGNGLPHPNYGFGRANLSNTFATDSKVYYDWALFDERIGGLTTGGKKTYSLFVGTDKPLRLTLAWTDKEGCSEPTCAGNLPRLVNDLDLVVMSPTGRQYNGNDLSNPFNDNWDRRNNVERVEIATPERGLYTIEVRGYNVPFGPQDYALVGSYHNPSIIILPAPLVQICMRNGTPC